MKFRDVTYILAVLICGTALSSGFLLNPYRYATGGGGGWGGGAPLVDGLTNVTHAYSVTRLLVTGYAGAAIRVRESGGNTEADIGFASGVLDTAALSAHCGSNSGYVVKVYDQVGSTNWEQTTSANQPRIVNAGTIHVDGHGKPRIYFDGAGDKLTGGPSFTIPQTDLTVAMMVPGSGLNITLWAYNYGHGIDGWDSVLASRFIKASSAVGVGAGTPGQVTSPFLWYYSHDGTTAEASINNSSIAPEAESTSGTLTSAAIGGPAGSDAGIANIWFQERINFSTDAVAQKATWEANINAFYTLW